MPVEVGIAAASKGERALALWKHVPPERLAVTVFAATGNPPKTGPDPKVARIKALAGEVTVVPMEFAVHESGAKLLAQWTDLVPS